MPTTIRVRSIDDFVDERNGFFREGNHFSVPTNFPPGARHHFLISKARSYIGDSSPEVCSLVKPRSYLQHNLYSHKGEIRRDCILEE